MRGHKKRLIVLHDGKAAFPEFHHVYIDPASFAAYNTASFPTAPSNGHRAQFKRRPIGRLSWLALQ
jgi:hypothetical protein